MMQRWSKAVLVAAMAAGLGLSGPAFAKSKMDDAKTAQTSKMDAGGKMGDTKMKKEPTAAQKAQQQRMKDCGAEWQKMKAAGKTGGKTWRQFSNECLKKK